MNNVLRILGIVAASMLLGLVALFLALFSICGGLESSEGGGVLAVCLLLIVGAVGLIVVLGRGLASSRSTPRGLAVAPAAHPPPYAAPDADVPGATPAGAPPAPAGRPPMAYAASRPVLPLRPISGTDRQVLIGLRIALAVYILLSIGSMAVNVASFSRFGSSIAVQLILRNVLSVLPPAAVLLAVSIRTPPAALALDAAAGLGIASILFRFGFFTFSGPFSSTLSQTPDLTFLFLRLGAFTAIEAAVAGMAIHLRSRVAPLNPGALIVATLAFLFWDGLMQVVMQALVALAY